MSTKQDRSDARAARRDKRNYSQDRQGFWMDLIKNVGVPTAIAFYLLMSISPRFDKALDLLTEISTILKVRPVAERTIEIPTNAAAKK